MQWKPFYKHKRSVLTDLVIKNDFKQFVELYKNRDADPSEMVPGAWEGVDVFDNIGGRKRRIHFLAAPVFDVHGVMVGAVETLIDITGQDKLPKDANVEALPLYPKSFKNTLPGKPSELANIIGGSRAMQRVYELIIQAAAPASVIIYGESGTGKELVARAIHDMSDRRAHNFVTVNCGAIPENLFESEFFGYRKGAFTGAQTNKKGFLDIADGGTLFLDEVGELTLNMQIKLLRVLEGGNFIPLGSNHSKTSDLRIVAATNRNLPEMVATGAMRDDFFYRIYVIPVHLPALMERKEDLPLLIKHLIA